MILRAAAVTATLLLAIACSESGPTSLDDMLDLSMTIDAVTPEIIETPDGRAMRCDFNVRVSGEGPQVARVQGATMRIFAGPDRSEPYDTVWFDSAQMTQTWEFASVYEGVEREVPIRVTFPVPFEFEFEPVFEIRGRPTTEKLRATCGPAFPAGGVQMSQIQTLSVTGNDQLRPGDTVRVTLAASSNYGLWESRIWLSGPFSDSVTLHHGGFPTMGHEARFVVPLTATPNAPVEVSVMIIDAAGQVNARDVPTAKHVVDLAPPQLVSVTYGRQDSGPVVASQAGVAGTFRIATDASDDLGLAWVVVDVDGVVRDSMRYEPTLDFLVPSSWVGATSLGVRVRDRAGKSSATIRSTDGVLNFYPVLTRAHTQVAIDAPFDVAFDAVRRRFYLADPGNARINIVDAVTMTALPSIPVRARSLDLTPTGDTLIAVAIRGDSSEIAVIDLRGPTPVTAYRFPQLPASVGAPPSYAEAFRVRVDSLGRWVISVLRGGPSPYAVAIIDPVSLVGTWVPLPGGGSADGGGIHLARSDDRGTLALNFGGCTAVLRVSVGQFGACRVLGDGSFNSADVRVLPLGDRIVAGGILYDADLTEQSPRWSRPAFRLRVVGTPDPSTIYFLEDGVADRARTSDGRRLDRLVLGAAAEDAWISADGAWLYVLMEAQNQIRRFPIP